MASRFEWEYKTQNIENQFKRITDDDLKGLLNEWNEAGWDVVSLITEADESRIRIIVRRPKMMKKQQGRTVQSYS